MNNKDLPNMQTVTALTKFLIDLWRGSKCPHIDAPAYCYCVKCKYNALCSKLEELSKVVNK